MEGFSTGFVVAVKGEDAGGFVPVSRSCPRREQETVI
jgi:hypothetical protein